LHQSHQVHQAFQAEPGLCGGEQVIVDAARCCELGRETLCDLLGLAQIVARLAR
jgi:hypothetical protein